MVRKWYVVTVGKEVGVFNTWLETQPLVIGVSGSLYQSFKSETKAHDVFEDERSKGNVRKVDAGTTRSAIATTARRPAQSLRPAESLPQELKNGGVSRASAIIRSGRHSSGSSVDSAIDILTSDEEESSNICSSSSGSTMMSSPPTGVTQVINLSPMATISGVLSPLFLEDTRVPETHSPHSSRSSRSTHRQAAATNTAGLATDHGRRVLTSPVVSATIDLSSSSAVRHSSSSGSAQAVSSSASLLPPITVNVHLSTPATQCSTCHHGFSTYRRDLPMTDTFVEQLEALGLSPDRQLPLPRRTDPRSPIPRSSMSATGFYAPLSTSSPRPSPRTHASRSMLFSS